MTNRKPSAQRETEMFNKKVSGDTTPVAPDDESVLSIYPLPPRDRGQETQGVSLLTSPPSIFSSPLVLCSGTSIPRRSSSRTGWAPARQRRSTRVPRPSCPSEPFSLLPPSGKRSLRSLLRSFCFYYLLFIIYYLLFIIYVYN